MFDEDSRLNICEPLDILDLYLREHSESPAVSHQLEREDLRLESEHPTSSMSRH